MSEFFLGWRRKVGVVALVISLCLTMAWIRGLFFLDFVMQPDWFFRNTTWVVGSSEMGIELRRTTSFDFEYPRDYPTWHSVAHCDNQRTPRRKWYTSYTLVRHWDFCGFFVDEGSSDFEQVCDWIIPYWSTAIPLALLSAYLLLSKPRKPKTQLTEPDRTVALIESIRR